MPSIGCFEISRQSRKLNERPNIAKSGPLGETILELLDSKHKNSGHIPLRTDLALPIKVLFLLQSE
jgi:hypothetical protein